MFNDITTKAQRMKTREESPTMGVLATIFLFIVGWVLVTVVSLM